MRRAPQHPSARRRSYRSRCRWMGSGLPLNFVVWVNSGGGPTSIPGEALCALAIKAQRWQRLRRCLLDRCLCCRLRSVYQSRHVALPFLPQVVRPTISVPNQRLGAQSPCRVAAGDESYVPCGVASIPRPQHMVVLQASVTAHVVVWLHFAFVTNPAARNTHGPRSGWAIQRGRGLCYRPE